MFVLFLFLSMIILFVYHYIRNARKHIENEGLRLERRKGVALQEIEEAKRIREEQLLRIQYEYDHYLDDKEFVNKNSNSLEEFIFNKNLNTYDLEKLARLNDISLEIHKGWHNITLDLVKELAEIGWKGRVGCIKQKFGELRFYASLPKELVENKESRSQLDRIIDKYTEISLNTCEICGESGKLSLTGGWQQTLCELHKETPVFEEYIVSKI